jgi:peptide-methionine (S)-S-oxide reductase
MSSMSKWSRFTGVFCVSLGLTACHGATSSATGESNSGGGTSASDNTNTTGGAVALHPGTSPGHVGAGTPLTPTGNDQLAAFAAGCFWGVEDAFRHVPGVVSTAVGYAGGHTTNPDYEAVCTHTTGHAETVLVEFDPAKISYAKLVQVFFKIHDPTQVNRQGPDYGDSYRSVIFYFSPEQQKIADAAKVATAANLNEKVATQIVPITPFWRAEQYHQQYSERTGDHSCPISSQLGTL